MTDRIKNKEKRGGNRLLCSRTTHRLILIFAAAILFQAIPGIFDSFGTSGFLSRIPLGQFPKRINGDLTPLQVKLSAPCKIKEPNFHRKILRKSHAEFPQFSTSDHLFASLSIDRLSDKTVPQINFESESVIWDSFTLKQQQGGDSEFSRDYIELLPGFQDSTIHDLVASHDFDNGEHMALLIRDPNNTRNLRGYIHIPVGVWGAQLKPDILSSGRALACLRDAMLDYTGIIIEIDRFTNLDSPDFSRYPFLYITADDFFELTKPEIRNLREYLEHGGFVFIEPYGAYADSTRTPKTFGPIRQMISVIFGGKQVLKVIPSVNLPQMINEIYYSKQLLVPIPPDHELYHCFFNTDISDGSPIPYEDIIAPHQQPRTCLDGVFIKGRLALVYSEKRYGEHWRTLDRIQQGINIIVYTLGEYF